MTSRPLALLILAAIAGLEALALLVYALFDVVEAFRVGITGPAEVSNPMALIVLIAITLGFGIGLGLLARGWWGSHRWARAPFVMAQVIIGLIGYELSGASGSVERSAGIACMVVAGAGLVLSFLPQVGRAIDETHTPL